MIELTDQQAAQCQPNGPPITVFNPRTHEEFVLLRREEYDRLSKIYDDDPWTDDERDFLRLEALDALGWEGMDAYQDESP